MELVENATSFEMWKKPEVDIYRKYYLFDVINPDQVISGQEKPYVVERGPYVYKEMWSKQNIKFIDKNTVSYSPVTTLYFLPNMSNGSLTDKITFVNVPVLVINLY